jgi:hypothetical protein
MTATRDDDPISSSRPAPGDISCERQRDIGSRAHHATAQDCVRSVVFTSSSATECYWTSKDFGGWQGKTPKAGPYSSTLGMFGF